MFSFSYIINLIGWVMFMYENYNEIFKLIKEVTLDVFKTMPLFFDRVKNPKEKYIYLLVHDSFKNIECILECLDIDGLTSSCVLMRQLIEQVSYVKVLSLYKDKVLDEYVRFYNTKQQYVHSFGNVGEDIVKLLYEYEIEDIENTDIAVFLEQGWLRLLTDKTDNKMSDLMKLANLKDLIAWRRYFNNFVHLALASNQFVDEKQSELKNNLSYILCVLFDQLIVTYHSLSMYDYLIYSKSFRSKYKNLWENIKNARLN